MQGPMASPDTTEEDCNVYFRVVADESLSKICITGEPKEIGSWSLHSCLRLQLKSTSGELVVWQCDFDVEVKMLSNCWPQVPSTAANGHPGNTGIWESEALSLPRSRFPFNYRCFANAHRSSPTTRPLVWDTEGRTCTQLPADGIILCNFFPLDDTSQSGWVTTSGAGAFQLRIGQPKSAANMKPFLNIDCQNEEGYDMILHEAVPRDPAVPEGKEFAVIESQYDEGHEEKQVVYVLNGQSFEALAFQVDVVLKKSRMLLARGLVSHHQIQCLEGTLLCGLMTPQMKPAGYFEASYLVVVSCEHPDNNLRAVNRKRWNPSRKGQFYDIGHRGSGASIKEQRLLQENTVLAFQKAANDNAEFVEFDVHVTQDGAVVIHHDFTVKVNVGDEVVPIGVPALTSHQLQTRDMMFHMFLSKEHRELLNSQEQTRKKTLKRSPSHVPLSKTSWNADRFAELHIPEQIPEMMNGQAGGICVDAANGENGKSHEEECRDRRSSSESSSSVKDTDSNVDDKKSKYRIPDKLATLREAFEKTTTWLGFNIELKYPTDEEKAALATRFYSRSYFVDAVLKEVFDHAGDRPVIFSTFDPDCATLLSLKQPRYPVFFLTCAGTQVYTDPRMNSLDAALYFASSSRLEGVVAESSAVLRDPVDVVSNFHACGLSLFTWGHLNNEYGNYMALKKANVDGIILDDVTKMRKATMKVAPFRSLKSPPSYDQLHPIKSLADGYEAILRLGTAPKALTFADASPDVAVSH